METPKKQQPPAPSPTSRSRAAGSPTPSLPLPRDPVVLRISLLRVLPELTAADHLPPEAGRRKRQLARSLAALLAHFTTPASNPFLEQARREGGISRKSFCAFYGNEGCSAALSLLCRWGLLEEADDATRVRRFGVYRLNEKWYRIMPRGEAILAACRRAIERDPSLR